MKLTADKRNKLIAVGAVTVVLIGVIWYYLIDTLQTKLKEFEQNKTTAEQQRQKIDAAIKNAPKIEQDLNSATDKLNGIQQEMASGDLYSWMYTTIKNFSRNYRVDIPQFSTVEAGENNLIHQFPYKQVKIAINGSAYFHDFGRFIADFENRFPHIRVENIVLEPATGPEQTSDHEKLSFRMEVVALVNSVISLQATETK